MIKFTIKNFIRFTIETQIAKAWLEWIEKMDNDQVAIKNN